MGLTVIAAAELFVTLPRIGRGVYQIVGASIGCGLHCSCVHVLWFCTAWTVAGRGPDLGGVPQIFRSIFIGIELGIQYRASCAAGCSAVRVSCFVPAWPRPWQAEGLTWGAAADLPLDLHRD